MSNRRLRPGAACAVRSHVAGQLHQLVPHRKAVADVHEIHVAGPAGRHHRPAHTHRLRERHAQTLGAMQGRVAVAGRDEVPHLLHRTVSLVDRDALASHGRLQGPEGAGVELGVHTLDDQPDRLRRPEGGPERFDERERVLPLEVAVEIEDEQPDELVAIQAEACSAPLALAGGTAGEDRRHPDDRYRRHRRERVRDERAGRPDFVVVHEAVVPLLRELRQLPEPHGDVAAVAEEAVRQVRGHDEVLVGVHADEVHGVRVALVEFGESRVLGSVRRQLRDVLQRHRDAQPP